MLNVFDAPAFPADAAPGHPSIAALARWRNTARSTDFAALLAGVRSLLVLVPHADDETLGCGGLIAAASDAGIAVEVVVLTDGAGSHPASRRWPPHRLRACRRRELDNAVATLTNGRGRAFSLGMPDGRLGSAAPGLAWLRPVDMIVTTWRGDPHPDHQAAFAVAMAAARACRARLLAFPLWVLTTDAPPPADGTAIRVDISRQLARKKRALTAHASQLGKLIDDDPDGFVLDAPLRALFVRDDEIFVEVPRWQVAAVRSGQ